MGISALSSSVIQTYVGSFSVSRRIGSLDELVVATRNDNQAMNLLVDNTGKSTALYFNYGFFSIG